MLDVTVPCHTYKAAPIILERMYGHICPFQIYLEPDHAPGGMITHLETLGMCYIQHCSATMGNSPQRSWSCVPRVLLCVPKT